MRKLRKPILSILLTLVLSTSCFACADRGKSYSYVYLNANAGVELILKGERVESAMASDYNGAVVLTDLQLKGETIESAAGKIAQEAAKIGYVSKRPAIRVVIASDNARQSETLTESAKQGIASVPYSTVLTSSRVEDRERAGLMSLDKKYNKVTSAQLRMLKSLNKFEDGHAPNVILTEKTQAIANRLNGYYTKYEQCLTPDLFKSVRSSEAQKIRAIDSEIGVFYGENNGADYRAKLSVLTKLQDWMTDTAKEVGQRIVTDSSDASRIATLLKLSSTSALRNSYGNVTVQSVEEYMEKREYELKLSEYDEFKTAASKAGEILDKYDTERTKLFPRNITRLTAIIGEHNVTTILEGKELVVQHALELTELKNAVIVPAEKQAEIDKKEKSKDAVMARVYTEYGTQLAAALTELRAKKSAN